MIEYVTYKRLKKLNIELNRVPEDDVSVEVAPLCNGPGHDGRARRRERTLDVNELYLDSYLIEA